MNTKRGSLMLTLLGILIFGCSQNSLPTEAPVTGAAMPSATPKPAFTNVPATSTPRPTATLIPTATEIVPGAVLFKEDFENYKAEKFVYVSDGWRVSAEENGNQVFEIDTNNEEDIKNDNGGGIGFGSEDWTNYSAEYRVKMLNLKGNAWLSFRSTIGDNQTYYVEWLSAEYDAVGLYITLNFDGWTMLKSLDNPVWDERWYHVKVEAQGSRLRVYLDGNLMLQTDDSRITSGGFNLGVFPGTHALFDDIRVIALGETP